MDPSNYNPTNPPSHEDDYLWDGSGTPDSEVQHLETLLGQFHSDRPAPALPPIVPESRWFFLPRLRLFPSLAAATCAAALIVVIALAVQQKKPNLPAPGWDVSTLSGTPHIGRQLISIEAPGRLGVGQILETDDHSRATIESSDVGQVEIDPLTRLRLLTMSSGMKQIALDRGTIHAHIWAPPGEFVVNTPSAVTVDLGCAYTLQVDDSGTALIRTSLGWVGFKLNGRESFIPAGAACSTRPHVGPGTPYFEDASAEFRVALERFDFVDDTSPYRTADLDIVLAQARKRDTLTLWHLLSRVDNDQRARVYDRLQKLSPPPASVTREGILRLDQPMLDSWWNALGFDDISIWRHWEHAWSSAATSAAGK
jgi:hypothetical protein